MNTVQQQSPTKVEKHQFNNLDNKLKQDLASGIAKKAGNMYAILNKQGQQAPTGQGNKVGLVNNAPKYQQKTPAFSNETRSYSPNVADK